MVLTRARTALRTGTPRSARSALGLLLAGAAALAAPEPLAGQRAILPGDPLPGLTPAEYEEFLLGRDDFLEVETAGEGLGPAYNGTSCAICHVVPAIGGIAPMTTTRVGLVDDGGAFHEVEPAFGTLFQSFSIPPHECQTIIPAEAGVIATRIPIPLFGAGLVEAIPDAALEALADPLDLDRDGISGRAPLVPDRTTGELRVGRFGWKSQQGSLMDFGAEAYRNELGITNDLFPRELTFRLTPGQLARCDAVPDPEDIVDPATGRRGIDNLAAFLRLLAPPARGPLTPAAQRGRRAFEAIGCAACHTPALVTGPSSHPVFDRRTVPLFSDLLLHDVGTGDGIRQAGAEPEEIRTPALWGLRFRRPLLHDGSAPTVVDAVRRHAGEAALARAGFDGLPDGDREALLAFLESL